MPLPRCETCGSVVDCETDSFTTVIGRDGKAHQGYGRMVYVHNGPCIPIRTTFEEECDACGRKCRLERPRKGREAVVCSDICRERHANSKQEKNRLAVIKCRAKMKASA